MQKLDALFAIERDINGSCAARTDSDSLGRAPRSARNGVSAAFTIAHLLATGNWDSNNPVFTMRALPVGQPPGCGARLRSIPRHAMVPFPFRNLSQFTTGTGKSVRHKLRQ